MNISYTMMLVSVLSEKCRLKDLYSDKITSPYIKQPISFV